MALAPGKEARWRRHLRYGSGGNKYLWQSDANATPSDPDGLDGHIGLSANVFIRGLGPDLFTNPPQLWIGPHRNDFLYTVFQETAVASGKWQAAVQTVRRPSAGSITKGYGFHPLRLWGKTFLADIGKGQFVLGSNPDPGAGAFMPGIYFQKTKHLDPADGAAYFPDHYDGDGRPYKDAAETVELGGVQRAQGEPNELSVRIWRDATKVSANNWTLGNDLNFQDVTNGPMKLADLVRSTTPKLKVARGEVGLGGVPVTDGNQNPTPYTLAAQAEADLGSVSMGTTFSSPFQFVVLLTPRRSTGGAYVHGVQLSIGDRTNSSFTVLARNTSATVMASFYVEWIAVGT